MALSPRRKRKRLAPGALSRSSGSAFARGRKPAQPVRKPKPPSAPASAGFQPPKVPTASQVNTTPGALSGGTGGYDIEGDPAVAAARGLAAKMRAQATATALAKRQQAAIEYGSAEGLEKDLGGKYADVSKTASENPYSVIKGLSRNYDTGVRDLEEGLNQANLFYSGYRGQQLGEAAHAYGQGKYNAATSYRGLLSDINENLANALLNADAMEINALGDSSGGAYGSDEGGGDGDTSYALFGGYGQQGTKRVPGQPTSSAPSYQSYSSPAYRRRVNRNRLKAGRM